MATFGFGFLIGVISGILLWEHWNKNNIIQNTVGKVKGDGNTLQQELFPNEVKPQRQKKGFLWGLFKRKKQP